MTMPNETPPQRFAVVHCTPNLVTTIESYMPANYAVIGTTDDAIVIAGHDNAGWTLEDYVIPRLASGLYFAEELVTTRERV
jgi:hypothetical protein